VIVDGTDEHGAGTAFDRFRQTVADHHFPQIGKVTVSIGYTRVGFNDVPASAVGRADSALYYAKEHGRNCTVCHEALLRDGRIRPSQSPSTELELF